MSVGMIQGDRIRSKHESIQEFFIDSSLSRAKTLTWCGCCLICATTLVIVRLWWRLALTVRR